MKQNQWKESCTYDAALYLRLSRDDEDIDGSAKTESNSISSQRELLRNFVKSQTDIQIFDIYVEMKIANLIQFESLNTQEIGRNKGLLTYSTMSEAFIFLQSSMRKKIRGFKC